MNTHLNELRRLLAEIDSLAGSVEVSGLIRDARTCTEKARNRTAKAAELDAHAGRVVDASAYDALVARPQELGEQRDNFRQKLDRFYSQSHGINNLSEIEKLNAEIADLRQDKYRLNFMLADHRKVIVEVLPGNRKDVYVEEGFMGDVQSPAFTLRGDIGSDELLEGKRRAIDLAMQQGGDANGN
ncbi:TPA: hypothetical protein SHT50_001301 [Pseudomonas aeruginosa]|nr:hypothetical protein [Pseudomonas aeruginosa]HEH6451078.1 hypothetical protein [Pseudomonas aeruginosa]